MIAIRGLCKRFNVPGRGSVEVLRDIDLDVPDRTITAVIGPSGAGKTTLSKCISLLEKPTSGFVLVNGKNLSGLSSTRLRAERRAIGTIFQSSALLRRRTAAQNIALPLEYLGVMPRAVAQRVAELLDQVGIADKADAYPAQLSGGQRQRVGIARALALHPQVLLSDEATSGLDPDATESILALLTTLRDQLGLSIILITHEMDVVRKVADRVAVLRAGTIVESGSVRDLISDPQSTIGPQLLPIKPSLADDPYALALNVTYAAHTPVPPDWISLAGEHLDARIGLLGGIVEDVAARAAGRLRITIAPRSGRRLETEAVERYLTRLGLIVTRPAGTERSADLTTGAV